MKQIYTTGLFALLGLVAQAQSNTVSGGGTATGSGGSVTYTIGQIDYSNANGSNGSYNEGVQQPFEFFKESGIAGYSMINLSIYPNPTEDFVVLSIEQPSNELKYVLYDMKGRILTEGEIKNSETNINMGTYSAGDYHLSISDNKEKIESFKIIKH